jgi:hypothetical protein
VCAEVDLKTSTRLDKARKGQNIPKKARMKNFNADSLGNDIQNTLREAP